MIRSFFESNAFLQQQNRDLQIELCCLCKVSAMLLKMASSLEIHVANEFLNPGFGNAEIMDFGRLSDLEPVFFGARTMPNTSFTSGASGRSQHQQHYPPLYPP